jgi:hypothetical protein
MYSRSFLPLVVVTLVLAACGRGSNDTEEVKRKPVDATVEGVHFSISLPTTLRPDPDNGPGVWVGTAGGNDLHVFTVIVDPALVTSIDKAKYQSTMNMGESRFERAEQRADGFALTNITTSGQIEAIRFVSSPAGSLKCKAIAKRPHKTARVLVESICDSLAVK